MENSKNLSTLSPNSDKNSILVRATRIWEAINKRTGAALHTNVILLDEKENLMVAVVRNNQKHIYLSMLNEGDVYNISNVKVIPGPKQYKSVEANYSINFFYKTKIEKEVDTAIIPRYKFELKSFADVNNLVGNVAMLIDVIGMVKSYGKLERRTNGAHKIDIFLTDSRNAGMVVTLWEDRAVEFLNLMSTPQDGPVFLVITGLLAKKFSDAASLSSTDATRCYVNIDYNPLKELRQALTDFGKGKHETLLPPTIEQFVTSTGDNVQELPITTILDTMIPNGTQVVRCICRAKIVAILNGNGWYYNCCPLCARALRPLDGKFYCQACNEEPEKIAQRFRIVVQVEDHSGTTTVTLFNKEAEQLVGIPLQKILEAQVEEGNIASIPAPVKNIIGKFCAFQLKITPYNINQGCEEYTVSRVSEIATVDGTATMLPGSSAAGDPIGTSAPKKQRLA